ncbi:MAG: hypothetical protein AMXMBFR58_08750 [Phycisphaerae bacterium]|nr:hypothetical protein [Phycisphaerales bacterium]MCK6476446.1 hypothetical protein [Phycisphaerales bacterium]
MTVMQGNLSASQAGAAPDKKKLVLSIAAVVVSIGLLGFVVLRYTLLAPLTTEEASRRASVVDAKTGKVYERYRMEEGEAYPWENPDTGERTLYPAELCYWTKDGKAKAEPTYVLLNELVGKPGKTICPDCGRVVVGHNPLPPLKLMHEAFQAAKQ